MTETTTDALHDRKWLAARIHKSVDWINHNIGRIPHIKIGRDVWFTEEHAQAFLKAHEVNPTIGRTPRSRHGKRSGR